MLLLVFVLLQEAKEQLSPLSVALERLQQEKQELLDRKRLRQEEGQEKVRDAHQTPPHECFRSRLCLQVCTCLPESVVAMVAFCCKQVNAIKERAKGVSALEREISKYVEEGKDEYKEVGGLLRS